MVLPGSFPRLSNICFYIYTLHIGKVQTLLCKHVTTNVGLISSPNSATD